MKEVSVGIDLGTTNSTISTCWPEGQPRLIRDDEGSGIIPSVVSFTEQGKHIVGQKAKQRMLIDMDNTFYSIKRFIGRDMRKDENQWAASQYPFTVESGPNGVPLAVTGERKIHIHQVSGYIIKHLIEMSANSMGQQVNKAVITVPANFNESQRKATKQAGESAGLEVLRIFNEPTAAALAYGIGKTEKELVAIYDFGGGTFDITILRLEDPVFEVLATAGDTMLGGDDLDRLILQDMLNQFNDQYGFMPEKDSNLLQRFLFGAERMKCQLSDWIVTAFEDRHGKDAKGGALKPFHYELNREKFKKITFSLGERSLEVSGEALRRAGLNPPDISQVILVGGTTRIPYLRKIVEDFFGRPPLDKIQPDVVVSIGASIQAYSLAGGEIVYPASEKDMLPTLSHKRVLPKAKGAANFTTDFGEKLDLSDEVEMEEEKEADAARMEIKKVPASGDDRFETPGQKSLEKADTVIRKSIPPQKQPKAQPPAPKYTSQDLDVDTIARAPSQSLLDALKKSHEEKPKARKPSAPKKTDAIFPGAAIAGGATADDATDIESLIKSSEVPDMEVILPKPKPQPSPRQPLALSLEDLDEPPQPVTPESLNEPYVPKDILKQIDEIHRKEMEEEKGEIASVGPVQTTPEKRREPGPQPQGAHAPLLLDVTPSTLGVATVGGYVEFIIKKNSPVPVEKGHLFTTSADDQEKVVVRILEGEFQRAEENNELGVIEIPDLRPAPRGTIKIEVTFDISVDGILQISAKNLETKKAQKAKLTLFGT